MNQSTVETEDTSATLLELAANNDIEGFKRLIEADLSSIDEVGLWYGRQKGSKQMVLEHRTPLMVAAMYGSIDILKLILSLSQADVNRACGVDKTTALHCAASGGSFNAVDAVNLLLAAGADPNVIDVNGLRPVDVIVVSPKLSSTKLALEELLATDGVGSACEIENPMALPASLDSNLNISPPLSPTQGNGSPLSDSDLHSSPKTCGLNDSKKEYPVDPSLPDIKNSIYSTDEFRMFSFKVRPCSRAYSHDWTECPFVHPGENARRRDPRKYHYSCVPCPDFRKGACRRGDMCEYAHGVFECWLHPAQYRTRLCKDGTSCNRRVCFFAHTQDELRPLYVSTGSAVPSPCSTASAGNANALDFAAAMSLLPGSPSFTPPMSPSANGISNMGMGWPQPNVPALHLPGSNLQSSRLRSSLHARDIPTDQEMNLHLLNELSQVNRSPHPKTILTPTNLDDIFSAESSSSPRYSDQSLASAVFSPRHSSSAFSQFQQHQSMLSPINTSFSPKNVDHSLLRMSPRSVEPNSPMNSRVSMLVQREKQFRSLSSRELGGSNPAGIAGLPVDTWAKWGSSNGKADWAVNADDFGKLRRSSSFRGRNNDEEPDLSWVHSLVKESPQEMKEKLATIASGADGSLGPSLRDSSNLNSQVEQVDHSVLSAWIEQMQLDHLVAQEN